MNTVEGHRPNGRCGPGRIAAPIAAALLLWFATACGAAQEPLTGADWEIRALGVRDATMLAELKELAHRRPVTIAIVGQGGVSRSLLSPMLTDTTTFEYRMWPEGQPDDPATNTHDTQAAQVILSLTQRLGISVRLLAYQPSESWGNVAEALAQAGREADIVTLYQSFWGDVTAMVEAVRASERALFVSPYVEYADYATGTSLQSHAAKPWADGIPHFVTAIPAARSSPGELLTPRSGSDDTEVINFVAPSYYADGPGGTCPSAEVAAAVAAYIVAASPSVPTPTEVIQLMRETSTLDREALRGLPEFSEDSLAGLAAGIMRLHDPPEGVARKLDAPGLLSLAGVLARLTKMGDQSRPTDP